MDYIKPAECPYYLITRASLSLSGIMKRELAALPTASLKSAYLVVLICLWEQSAALDMSLETNGANSPITAAPTVTTEMKIKDLCKFAGVEPSTMTGLIDRMEGDGLIMRVSDSSDRRALNVKLTPAGTALQGQTITVVNRVLEQAFKGIDEADLVIVKQVFRKILINIGEE